MLRKNKRIFTTILAVSACAIVLIGTGLSAAAGNNGKKEQLKLGAAMPKPDAELTVTDESQTTLDQIAGQKKGTVVAFWANHCPFVVKYQDRFIELAKAYQDKGIAFIAVSSNDPVSYKADSLDNMRKRAKEKNYPFPYAFDPGSELAAAFGASKTPHIYLFNADRELVYVGAIDDSTDPGKVDKTYLKDAIDAVLAGDDVPVASTKAIGCSIKWQK